MAIAEAGRQVEAGSERAWDAGRSGRAALRRRQDLQGWLMVTPAFLLLAIFVVGPVLAVLVFSFTDYRLGARSFSFVGITNYLALLEDATFRRSFLNTLVYVGIAVPVSVLLGLGVALLINGTRTFQGLYRSLYFLPVMATVIAMAIVWEFLLHPRFGFFNLLLMELGQERVAWLSHPDTALPAIAVIGIWQLFPFNMVLILAGLSIVPRDLLDAARIDGASQAWQRFLLVTLPALSSMLVFVLVIALIRSFQVFDLIHLLTKGGPSKATEVLVYTMYVEGLQFFRTGYGAAITMVFLAVIGCLTLLKFRFLDRRAHYGGEA